MVSLIVDEAGWEHHLVTSAAVGGYATWHWWFVLAQPHRPERRLWTMVGYYAGILAFTAVLLLRSDVFQLVLPACYVLAFVALPGWSAYVGVVAANLPVLVVNGADPTSVLINVGMVTPLAALFGTTSQ